ncbi:MAG TPA: rhomboid family intramembrane serine protease [Stellaceae bacterium]|jgi:membrane associated rhomboid family serine protease|nr:rhomboid family intramembrane serine protease [Stellaceae bacterium]
MTDRPAPSSRQPIFNIPAGTMALLIINIAVHGLRLLLSDSSDDRIVRDFAFIPARYTTGLLGWPALVDPVTYQFLHANLTHLFVNMLALLAFGSGVERRIGRWRMLALAILSGIIAAGAHLAVYPSSDVPVVGASGAISGLFGAVLRMMSRGMAGRRSGLWPLIALWVIVTVIAGQTGMPGEPDAPIAWVAHLGGFAAGLALFGFFDRTAGRRSA